MLLKCRQNEIRLRRSAGVVGEKHQQRRQTSTLANKNQQLLR